VRRGEDKKGGGGGGGGGGHGSCYLSHSLSVECYQCSFNLGKYLHKTTRTPPGPSARTMCLGSILNRRRDAEQSRPAQVSAAFIEFWTFKQNCTQSTAAMDCTKTVEFAQSSPHQQRLDLTASKLLKWDDPQLVLGTSLFLPYKQRMFHTVYFCKCDTV